MKHYIENKMKLYPTINKTPLDVLEHTFATLGNGIDLNNKDLLHNEKSELFDFGEAIAIDNIYPWSETEDYQPFRKYQGCRNEGFKEALVYFVECIKVTSLHKEIKPLTEEELDILTFLCDEFKDFNLEEHDKKARLKHYNMIKPWKDNIHLLEKFILEFKPSEDKYTKDDSVAFLEDIKDEKDCRINQSFVHDSITKINVRTTKGSYDEYEDFWCKNMDCDSFYLDVKNKEIVKIFKDDKAYKEVHYLNIIYSDAPQSVLKEVQHLWSEQCLGNDDYVHKVILNDELFEMYPCIYFWCKHKGVLEDEVVYIHFWW